MTKHERIDLTQFEGIGEWKVIECWDEEEARYEIRTGRDNHSKHEAEVIAKLPNLIAELKKSYETIDYLATHAMVTGDFCPMCLTYLDEKCQHIIRDDTGYTTTFGVWNPETNREEQHVHWERNSLKPSDEKIIDIGFKFIEYKTDEECPLCGECLTIVEDNNEKTKLCGLSESCGYVLPLSIGDLDD